MVESNATKAPSPVTSEAPPPVVAPVVVPKMTVDICLMFGGQGYAYLPELRAAHAKADGTLARAVVAVGLEALEEEEKIAEGQGFRAHIRFPMNGGWVVNADDPQPSEQHMRASFCSYPLIFLAQMANYADALDRLQETQETFLNRIKGGSGHSQGVVSAVVISLSPTNQELLRNVGVFVRYMFWQGLRSHISNALQLDETMVVASPMLSVSGISSVDLNKQIMKTTQVLKSLNEATLKAGPSNAIAKVREELSSPVAPLHLALINGQRSLVVSGKVGAIRALKDDLQKISAPTGSQARVPFSNRKPEVSSTFLAISAPFHSPLNEDFARLIEGDWDRLFADYGTVLFAFPVISTADGTEIDPSNLKFELIRMQSIQQLNFPAVAKAVVKLSSTVMEFGPANGASKLLVNEQEGSGLLVITSRSTYPPFLPLVTSRDDDEDESEHNPHVRTSLMDLNAYLLALSKLVAVEGPNWREEFAPKIVFSAAHGKHVVDTKFTRLTCKPPVVMAGMTPTTGFHGINLVSACTTAGYHGELAGGGLPLPDHFNAKVNELTEKNPPGAGINLNVLYLNAHLWGFQFPLFVELARSGVPMESLTIAAGVPTGEKAAEILAQLASCGCKYISLKPGSVQAIRDSLSIAAEARKHNISLVLQWTGGRGGGHHSFEDFHEPLLETYSSIRKESNVVLIVGSGFGDAEGSFPYLTGSWSESFGRPRMPCDGILMGSRCMVAREAATATKVKELIVATAGVENEADWEKSYDSNAGGIITLTSELGEPIHKVANRGMQCWRDFDRKYFSIERGPKRVAAILRDKQEIINRLNADFQKVYFGAKYLNTEQKTVPCDLEEMTYYEVLRRMVELMFVTNGEESSLFEPNRWIDVTYQTRTFVFLVRSERRFRRDQSLPPVADDVAKLRVNPMEVIESLAASYPDAKTTLLADDDVSYFVDLCRDLRNGKPVNFVPRIDGDLDFWVKKDSLWCSEDLDAIPGRDPQRVCILQGPVAVRHSFKVDEPIADIMGSVHDGWVQQLLKEMPVGKDIVVESLHSLDDARNNELEATFPWLKSLPRHAWQRTVLSPEARIVRHKRLVPNVIPRLLQVAMDEEQPISVGEDFIASEHVEIRRLHTDRRTVVLRAMYNGAQLEIKYQFQPEIASAPLVEMFSDTKSLYEHVWLVEEDRGKSFSVDDWHEGEFVLSAHDLAHLNRAILRVDPQTDLPFTSPSLDSAIVCGWRPLIKTLFAKEIEGDLLQLVHLSHAYRLLNRKNFAARAARVGDTVFSRVQVTSIEIIKGSGKKITCTGVLSRRSQQDPGSVPQPWVEIVSSFLIRGNYTDYPRCFTRGPGKGEEEITLRLATEADLTVLLSKPWFKTLSPEVHPVVGDSLLFVIESVLERRASEVAFGEIRVRGRVFRSKDQKSSPIALIEFNSGPNQLFRDNPVLAYLRRHRLAAENGRLLDTGGATMLTVPEVFHVPSDPVAFEYGRASRDLNPIHSSRYFAALAGLPGSRPIVHGMWTCALARQVVERGACRSNPDLIHKFEVEFVGMVQFGETLAAQLTFLGVVGGRKVVRVEVRSIASNQTVLRGKAEVEQERTAFLFTGQGSASVGMGMDRYEEMEGVRRVWDKADAHLRGKYGFSILDIVRSNPKELIIHFGGPKGRELRENYRAIKISNPSKPGEMVQLLPEINADTKSFTFKSSVEGLLFATQFAQPALVIIQKAAFQELVDNGLVPSDACFAGHSLGEYAGLASFADVLTVEDLVETVFLRGMVMQNAVTRDARGRSAYGMVAVNPSRVKSTNSRFTADTLLHLVETISKETQVLLQVVNFNVRGTQYVVAGHLLALDVLEHSLSTGNFSDIAKAVERSRQRIALALQADVPFELERGSATIPLAGIDVPFHSRQLLSGVPAFRELLEPRLSLDRVNSVIDLLVGKYIPNVTARTFSLDVDYVEYSASVTGSKTLEGLVAKMKASAGLSNPLPPAQVARTLLIELLAHQFAMPVLWIETQDLIFGQGTRRVIEMGPAPTLVGMAQKTYESGIFGGKDSPPEILWWGRDMATVTYSGLENKGPSLDSFVAEQQQQAAAAAASSSKGDSSQDEEETPAVRAAPVPSPVFVAAAPTPQAVPSSTSTPDQPPTAKHALRVLLASKLKRPLQEIKDDSTIKSLSQGKSAVQNEIVGDLAAEFGLGQDVAGAETPLAEIASKADGGYKQLGKVTTQLVSRTLAARLPGAFPPSAARSYLASSKGLGPNMTESVLLHACGALPPSGRLAAIPDAKKWLDDACNAFANDAGITLGGVVAAAPSMLMGFDLSQSMTGGGAAAPVPDAAPTAKHSLQVLLANKLKVAIKDIKDDSTIKSLTQGKSAVQNEIVGDLAAEFPGVDLNNAAETSLADLATKASSTGYNKLGKVTSTLLARTLAAKLPGAFPVSATRDYLATAKRLGPSMIESVLLHSTAMAPAARLGSEDEAKAWMDQSLNSFASLMNINLSAGAGSIDPGRMRGGGGNVIIDSAALTQHQKRLADLIRSQVDAFETYLEVGGNDTTKGAEQEAAFLLETQRLADALKAELGDKFIDGIRPAHDSMKVREYDSYWNWVVQDALELHLHVLGTVRRMKGETDVKVPNADNAHFQAMSNWIGSVAAGNKDHAPPEAWFRNFLCNRATKELLTAVEFFAQAMLASNQPEYAQIISLLAEQVEAWVSRPPVLVARANHKAPMTTMSPQGRTEYKEVNRDGVEDCVKYVQEVACGALYSKDDTDVIFDSSSVSHPSQSVILEGMDAPLTAEEEGDAMALWPLSPTKADSRQVSDEESRFAQKQYQRPSGPVLEAMRDTVIRHGANVVSLEQERTAPLVHLRTVSTKDRTHREYDSRKTAQYLTSLHALATSGVSFAGQVCLVTGGGVGSIAIDVVKLLLEGGAVVVSAINYSKSDELVQKTLQHYRRIYEEHGSKGSRLITEPCNAGSAQDIDRLVDHIYETLRLDIDFIVPFAALPERGKDISAIDSECELAHRAMLTNVIRLLGKVKDVKQKRGINTRPAMVLLPCSPNHGVFGNDGLYAESKLGIESLVNKWRSEGWQDYLSIAACVFGWTRSALMWQNNLVAEGVEQLGCRTFSTSEMAVNLLALMHPRMVTLASEEPLWADLTGGWDKVQDLDSTVKTIRKTIQDRALVAQTLYKETTIESSLAISSDVQQLTPPAGVSIASKSPDVDRILIKRADVPGLNVPLVNPAHQVGFPQLPSSSRLHSLHSVLEEMVDLEKVVVVVGYGEVGPWGNAKTRWEMEAYGEFSLEGCVELAWLVGLIQHHDGPLPNNPRVKHVGWIDTSTKEPVYDHEVKRKYEQTILAHCGVRIIEPELFEGYNPSHKRVWTKVGIDRDLPLVEVSSKESALEVQSAAGGPDKCEIIEVDGTFKVKVKAGAVIAVPRAFQFNRFVVGQIPTGWSAERLGVPPEIAKAVDPVTLYALVSTMDAFVAAGVCDPYEMYEYVHVSQVGNTSGGGMGGMRSLKRMFTDRNMDDPDVPSDTLAESFINTMPAWVNMLLLSSSGPIKTPVGACATAAESVEIGMETILSGKARIVVCGGYDDFGEVGSFEFAQMGATQDNAKDRARGRRPDEASRPMTSSRAGFVESHGAGMQVLMDAKVAVEMGCPIYGIVGLTNTATDREGRSIPAPGRGILTTARETIKYVDPETRTTRKKNKMLDLSFRRREIRRELQMVVEWEQGELEDSQSDEERDLIQILAKKKRAGVLETYGQGFFKNLSSDVSPLTGALAVWGLTVDDIGVVSCHGTSTTLNDKNESSVVNLQMEHLGRAPGNVCLVVAQKWLTAHPKGAAAAWMLNGSLQMLNTGLVPGNRNLDNCAEELRKFPHLFYPNRSIQLPTVEAVLLKSFGFGQAGAEILLIHPDRVLSTLTPAELERYIARRREREARTYRYVQGVHSNKHGLLKIKTRAPYLPDQETAVYLNPQARASYDSEAGTWIFKRTFAEDALFRAKGQNTSAEISASSTAAASASKTRSSETKATVSAETRLKVTLQEQAEGLAGVSGGKGVGVDVEQVSTFRDLGARKDFIVRNFTRSEIEHCSEAADPSASFAGRWAAKEAVVKAISSVAPDSRPLWSGGHAPLISVEIVQSSSGAPVVALYDHARDVAAALGISEIKVSISHTGDVAVAQAVALATGQPSSQ